MLGLSISAGHGLSGPLYRADQIPEQYQEHFIVRGYRRPKSSFTQCLLSLFDATNETLNFWTHFLPFWYFAWLISHLSSSMDFVSDSYTWPLLCYLFTCCAFPLASAFAHLFNVMSENVRHICFFLDYAALSLFSWGSALSYRAYCFPRNLLSDSGHFVWFRDGYLYIAIFNAIACTVMTCQSRFMTTSPMSKIMRLASFSVPYLFDSVPIFVRIFTCHREECELSGTYFLTRQFFFTSLSAFLYASHLPERILPGIFDIVGHSHQLFHVATIIAATDQLRAILHDLQERRNDLIQDWPFHDFSSSFGMFACVFCINGLIVALFSFRLLRRNMTPVKVRQS